MKKINLAILFFTISSMMLMVYYGCKKDNDNKELIYGDTQTEELNLIVDSCSVLTPSIDSILDVYGIPYRKSKSTLKDGTIDKLVSDLIAFTHAKCEEKTKTFHNESSPIHFGFAYSYGQRNLQSRLFPPAGNSMHNKDAVWGTDCSGLLVNAIIYAGIPIENCNSVALPANLSFALAKSDAYKNIIVEDKGQLSIWQIKTGDIVLWPNVPHIGIVGRNLAGDVIIFQSNGTGFPENEASQTKNWLSETRGVHPFSMIKMLTMKEGWPSPYKVYRFKEKDPSPSGFTITTKSVSNITANSAQSGGDITFSSQVAPNISARGVCWSTNTNPTINDYKTNDGNGTGSFSSDISGLTSATTYFVRAYAQSEGVVYYGNQLSFQTTVVGGGNQSIITLTSDDYTVTLYPLFVGIQPSGVLAIIDTNLVGIIPHSFGFALSENEVLAVTSYDFNRPCNIPQAFDRTIQYAINDYIIWQNVFVVPCPDWEHYQTESNGILNISALTNNMISGTFNATLADINETGGYDFKCFTGTFTLYNSEEQHRISSINDFNHNSSSDFKIMKSE